MAEGKDRPCFQGGAFHSQVTHLVLLLDRSCVFFWEKRWRGRKEPIEECKVEPRVTWYLHNIQHFSYVFSYLMI